MRRRHLLALLGVLLIVLGSWKGDWALILTWLGVDFLVLAIAHRRGAHRIFGKRPDGTLPLWSRVFFLPLLAYTSLVWHLIRILSREPASHVVIANQLVIGRRLLPSEVSDRFDNYVDLTAEFAEPRTLRAAQGYYCFPILDGTAPTPNALHEAVCGLKPGSIFIHCAQGHGRTGLFALAVLLNSGIVRSVEDGMRMLQAARPGVRLNSEQHQCIQKYAEQIG